MFAWYNEKENLSFVCLCRQEMWNFGKYFELQVLYIWIENSVIQFICCTVAFIINIDSFKITWFLMEKLALKLLFWNFSKKCYDVSHSRRLQGVLFLFGLTLVPLFKDIRKVLSCKTTGFASSFHISRHEIYGGFITASLLLLDCRNFVNPVKDLSNSKSLLEFLLSYWPTVSSTITSIFSQDVLMKL